MTTTRRPIGNDGEIGRLAQIADEVDGVVDALCGLAFGAEGVDAAEAHAEEHRIILGCEVGQGEVLAEQLAGLDGDAADGGDVVHLGLRKAVGRLVGGDAVFVEAARLGLAVEDHDIVTVHGEPVGGREAGGARADNGDALAGRGCAGEELLVLGHRDVGGVALEHADLDRLALGCLAHAGLFAQLLGRADAGAHAAQDVLLENGFGGPERIVGQDLADEHRDVDARGAGGLAGRVEAEIAAIGLDKGFVAIEWGMQIGEVRGVLVGRQASRRNAGLEKSLAHSRTSKNRSGTALGTVPEWER